MASGSTETQEKVARLFVWAHSPGSALQALAVVCVAGVVVGWLFELTTARGVWNGVGTGLVLWSVGALVRRIRGSNLDT